ncbi:MAG: hypothetical protein AAB131_13085 [Actinomycetota bacterium]
MGKPKPPKLPDNAPQEVKDFIACTRLVAELDLAQLGWLPRPPGVPEAMVPTAEAASTGTNSAGIKVGWGFVSLTLPVSVAAGQLAVDTTDIPTMGGMKSGIDNWVKRFNDTLKSNGKELAGLEVLNGKVRLTKRVIGAAIPSTSAPATSPPATSPPAPTTTPTAPTPTPTPATTEPKPDGNGCLIGIIATFVLLIGGSAAAYFALRDGGDTSTSVSAPPNLIVTTTAAPSPVVPVPPTAAGPGTTLDSSAEKSVCAEFGASAGPSQFGPYQDARLHSPCVVPPADFWRACEPAVLPCFQGGVPFVGMGGDVVITHNGSVPDAVTQQAGPSQAGFPFIFSGGFAPGSTIELVSTCGAFRHTGRSAGLVPGTPFVTTIVNHPLRQFGPCNVESVVLIHPNGGITELPASLWGDDGSYTVTGDEVQVSADDFDDFTLPSTASFVAAGTVLNTMANTPAGALANGADEPGCFWYFAPDDVALTQRMNDACSVNARYWVFAAASGDPSLVAHGAGYINPLGSNGQPAADLDAFRHTPLFANTIFPCGPGQVGLTICPRGDPALDAGGFVAVSMALAAPLGLEPDDRSVEVSFAAAGGPTYRVEADGDAWVVTADSETVARAIARDDSLTLVVPQFELPDGPLSYVLTLESDGTSVSQLAAPVLGVLTSPMAVDPDAPPPAEAPEAETPEQFFAALSDSITTGNIDFALQRLHPVVLEAFPGDACTDNLSTRDDLTIEVVEVGEVGLFVYQVPDGRTFEVPDTLTVILRLSGQPEPTESHIVLTDAGYQWFTICT